MTGKFQAEAISSTVTTADNKRLEIAFSDAGGRVQTVSLTAATALCLSRVLAEFAACSHSSGPVSTKMPKEFAVGVGRHERVVLVRFEDDAPYGLGIAQAAQLGRMLVEQAEVICASPVPARH